MAMALHTPADHLPLIGRQNRTIISALPASSITCFPGPTGCRLQAPGFDTKWKSISLAATVPGLTRFSTAQDGSNVWRICHIARSPAGPVLIYSSKKRLRFMLWSSSWARANFNLD
jgi:hypothetical protein